MLSNLKEKMYTTQGNYINENRGLNTMIVSGLREQILS